MPNIRQIFFDAIFYKAIRRGVLTMDSANDEKRKKSTEEDGTLAIPIGYPYRPFSLFLYAFIL